MYNHIHLKKVAGSHDPEETELKHRFSSDEKGQEVTKSRVWPTNEDANVDEEEQWTSQRITEAINFIMKISLNVSHVELASVFYEINNLQEILENATFENCMEKQEHAFLLDYKYV
ncbi:hypothetical protein WN51_04384 [Melipona quadrifasciata]|uniref:Uncharacterized protein n=1 Tax=Melipona quadrifasciata TaxID=166423 RepID=A0A0M8ZU93_9HYME|nr:hypothetical protein WN51_04384 [Melipona quadrifasciata]